MLQLKQNIASGWAAGQPALKLIKGCLFFAALLLVAVPVFIPFSPGMPGESLDPSWAYGMNEALAQGMSFGKDIVFTFGPYASVYTLAFHPATDHLMIWGASYLAISFAIAAYLDFRLTSWPLKAALLAALCAVMYSRDALFFLYPLLVGVQVYHWAATFNSGRDAGLAGFALKAAVLFAPFGLLPLIKGSTLTGCAAISVLSIALLARRGQWKLCLLVGATPLVSLVIFWSLSGQPLSGLAGYFAGLASITGGYTESMATNGNPREYILYVVAVATLAVLLLREAQGSIYDKSVLVLMFLCILFLAFKSGFVRHDGHAVISATMILFAALLAGTLLTARSTLGLLFVCLIAWIYIDAAYMRTSSQSLKENVHRTFAYAWIGIKQRAKDPEALTRAFEARVHELKELGAIPKLNGSVDIYSYDQAHLIASGNEWNPRPIFQSYTASTSRLAELNKMHLVLEDRPDNIIFKVQPIDGRLPSLEDGASWPVLLSNYEPVSYSGTYLLLKNRSTPSQAYEEPTKIAEGVYSLGEQINLPTSDAPLFVKVDVRKSLVGAILNTLFKPSQLVIKLTMHNGATRDYRLIAGMSESGFVVSPLVETTEELGLLFTGANNLDDKKVKSIEIVAPHFSSLWKSSFEIGFYRFDFQRSPGFIAQMGFVTPRLEDSSKFTSIQRCDGSVDFANGISPTPPLIKATSSLNVHGWLAASLDLGEVPDKVYLVLSNSEGKHYFIDTKRTQRPDVGTHFNKPGLNSSGYATTANVSALDGQYHLGLAYSKGDEVFLCPQFHVPVELNQD